jgi:hypothetical protein
VDIQIHTGQWVASISKAMLTGMDGDCFVLPSCAHLHAFEIAKNQENNQKRFTVRIDL